MSDRPYHKNLRLENFTAFADATLDFVPGVNVFVGENGTGKTHAMKALYAGQRQFIPLNTSGVALMQRIFQVDTPEEFLRKGAAYLTTHVRGQFGDYEWYITVTPKGFHGEVKPTPDRETVRPVFIPAIDMMGHTKGFLAANNELVLDFDLTCLDIVTLLGLKRRNNGEQDNVVQTLSNLLGGEIDYDDATGRFYLSTPGGRMAMPMAAEGIRKIATLVRLFQNGWLQPGATLFWDEPEVNINPVLMDEVVGAILALARTGVQIFLATHSYVILKELDLQAGRTDSVRYFAFRHSNDGTTVNPTDDFALLEPNPILEQYDSLYDRDLTRATGRNRRGEPVR